MTFGSGGLANAQDTFNNTPERPNLQPAPTQPGIAAPQAQDCRLNRNAGGSAEVRYRGIIFQGNTVFATDSLLADLNLADASAPGLTIDDVECIRLAVTRRYIEAGYINSGVLARPPSTVGNPVTFQVIEGRLTEIRVRKVQTPSQVRTAQDRRAAGEPADPDAGQGSLWPEFIQDRLIGDPDEPLQQKELEGRFQALLQDLNVEQLNAQLVPGKDLGEAVLDVDVVQAEPLSFRIGGNNYDPQSTGEFVGIVGAAARNLIGFGDAVAVEFQGSRGKRSIGLDFEAPLSAEGLLFVASADYARTNVIEQPLDVLNIEGEFFRASAGLTYDVFDVGTERLSFGLRFDYQQSETSLLGEPFSFSPGAQNGLSRATVLRLFQEYVLRQPNQALSLRSTFSFGLPILNATDNSGGLPDGTFVSWLGEAFYVRNQELPFVDKSVELSIRTVSQISADPLLAFEQVALTGQDVVRGFREDAVVADNLALVDLGVRTSIFDIELPTGPDASIRPVRIFAQPFLTAGTAWNNQAFDARSTAVGGGIVFDLSPTDGLVLSLGIGTPIYASDSVQAIDAEDTRIYLSSELRF